MRGGRSVAVLALACALCISASACGGSAPQQGQRAPATPAPVFPHPTGPLYTPTPFALPSDGPGFWAALRDITPRLEPAAPGDEQGERLRLQACGHLRALAGAVIDGVSEDYEVEGFPELELVASANNCETSEQAESTHLALVWLIDKHDPYS